MEWKRFGASHSEIAMARRTTFLFAAALLAGSGNLAAETRDCAAGTPAAECEAQRDGAADTQTSPCSAAPAPAPAAKPAPMPSGTETSPCSALPADATTGSA
jgi:hypothetical protein